MIDRQMQIHAVSGHSCDNKGVNKWYSRLNEGLLCPKEASCRHLLLQWQQEIVKMPQRPECLAQRAHSRRSKALQLPAWLAVNGDSSKALLRALETKLHGRKGTVFLADIVEHGEECIIC